MTTQENVIKVIENSYKTKIESLSNSKDTKKVLVSKISELLTADNKFAMEVSKHRNQVLIFRTNKCERLSYHDLKSIIEICKHIIGLKPNDVEFEFFNKGGFINFKGAAEYNESDFNMEFNDIHLVYVDYSIC
jgi:hypothetical protein